MDVVDSKYDERIYAGGERLENWVIVSIRRVIWYLVKMCLNWSEDSIVKRNNLIFIAQIRMYKWVRRCSIMWWKCVANFFNRGHIKSSQHMVAGHVMMGGERWFKKLIYLIIYLSLLLISFLSFIFLICSNIFFLLYIF